MLKTNVLVKNVTNLHDARYCAGMGVEYISMPVAGSSDTILSAEQIKEIGEWLSGIQIIGDTGDTWAEGLGEYILSGIETENSQLVKKFADYNKPVILTLQITKEDIQSPSFRGMLDQLKDETTFFILLCEGGYESYDIQLIKEINEEHSVFWGFPFLVDNIATFLDEIDPHGIVLQGSKEIKTGLNDFDHLADMLEALDTDEYL
jgi:phosphoribosylanthranilate isomerase